MELRQLRYFVAIARLENMTAAAEELRIAQPALSAQVAKLEDEWGTALFERSGRGIRLTEAGRTLYKAAESLLDSADGIGDLAAALRRGAHGHLRLGYVRAFPFRDLTAILRTFRGEQPEVALTVRELDGAIQLGMVRRGELDVAFVQLAPATEAPGLRVAPVCAYPPMIVVPIDHALAGAGAIRLSQLAHDDWVLVSHEYDGGYRARIDEAFRDKRIEPRIVQEAADVRIILGLVAAGFGVTILLSSSRELQISDVRYVPFAEPPPAFRFGMAARSGAETGAVAHLRASVAAYHARRAASAV